MLLLLDSSPTSRRKGAGLDLKEAAANIHRALKARVAGAQGGVPTFFDNLLYKLLNRLAWTENVHSWNLERPAAPGSPEEALVGDLKLLSAYLANTQHGRFVSYATRKGDDLAARPMEVGFLPLHMSQ